MMTPQDTNNGMAIAELNNIPTYRAFRYARDSGGNIAYLNGRGKRTDKLSEGNPEEFRENYPEQLESCPIEPGGSMTKPDRVNHQNPVHDRTDDRVGDLR